MPPELRRALPADAAAIAEIARDALPERWSAQAFRTELEARGGAGWVAVDERGRIVAYALAARVATEVEIRSLAVAPAWRRCGLGRRLLAALLESQREAGASEVLLEVRRSNTAARRLYTGTGFEPRGERPRYYADGETAIVMGVRLCGA
jgi:ribosomal-protein-alanine N-acetyltransferase